MDYKNTLNLPRTDFAMKADLVAREPQRLARWEADAIYAQIRVARAGRPKFVLHDGPPFANGDVHVGTALNKVLKDIIVKYKSLRGFDAGDVHVGTALNKVLKDIIVKYKSLRGFDAPYIPGWDCHGLPIELKVTQDMRKAGDTASDAATIRTACDAYARKYIELQRTQFKRLGVFGDWQNPYLTLNKEYEADELRLFADLVAQGFVYRGKKPVYWSIPCRTALAEAEVEYADHVSQSVYVKFKLAGEPNTCEVQARGRAEHLPPHLDHYAVDASGEPCRSFQPLALLLAHPRERKCLSHLQLATRNRRPEMRLAGRLSN